MREHILFMDDFPVAVVEGDMESRQKILEEQATEYYESNKCKCSWMNRATYDRQKYWHYHTIERITCES